MAPRVLPTAIALFALGGTICGTDRDPSSTSTYRCGDRSIREILRNIPQVYKAAKLRIEQIANEGSPDFNIKRQLSLALKVRKALDNGAAEAVVAAGLDCITELAYLLDLVLRSRKPVAWWVHCVLTRLTVGTAAIVYCVRSTWQSSDVRGKEEP